MNSPERLPSETHKPITGYLWGALAVLTCPCHLPILAIVLAGTTAGAFSRCLHEGHQGRGLLSYMNRCTPASTLTKSMFM